MKTKEKSKLIKDLYKKYRVPKHVVAHMEKVAEFSGPLADKFIKKGFKVDKKLIKEAALLHDILRVCDFRNLDPKYFWEKVSEEDKKVWNFLRKKYGKIGHEKAAKKILHKIGEKELANLIGKHDFWKVEKLKTLEEKILYYADKKVEGDTIVSLKKRFAEGHKRNAMPGEDTAKRTRIENQIIKLEKEIFNLLRPT